MNLYKIRVAKDAGGELFRSAQRQKNQYQGIWIVSPDGRVLAGHVTIKSYATWTQEVLDTISAGLRAFGPVTPRHVQAVNQLVYRGVGVQPDGSVSLAVYVRYMLGGGQNAAPAATHSASRYMWGGNLRPGGPPTIDTLTLTAQEWAAFVPPQAVVGTRWSVPDAIARKLVRTLSPSSDQHTMPFPQEARVAELSAEVEAMDGGQARIRLAGTWEAPHLYLGKSSYAWATAEGSALYDRNEKSLRSLLLVFQGAYRMAPPYDKEDRPTGAVVEWRRDRSATSRSVLPQAPSLAAR